ncbi:hypothetical protein KKF82_08770 [Patescibacteria group bacterium]|nr:hypothetical protein [Patescibacteria group bacterium]
MVKIDGSAIGSAPPVPLEGDLNVYTDAACTEPLPEVSSVDFGTFPFTPCGGVVAGKTKKVWCKNESNYPMMLMINIDNPTIFLVAPANKLNGSIIPIGDVLEVELAVAINVPTDGSVVDFGITIGGNAIGAPK